MKIKDLKFKRHKQIDDDTLFSCKAAWGRITVLNRMTGFGYRDTETSYTDPEDHFWLASGDFDIRRFPELTIEEGIDKIKKYSNTCIGIPKS